MTTALTHTTWRAEGDDDMRRAHFAATEHSSTFKRVWGCGVMPSGTTFDRPTKRPLVVKAFGEK